MPAPTTPNDWLSAANSQDGAWIEATRVFDGQDLLIGQGVLIRDGRVAAVGAVPRGDGRVWRVAGTLCPGFLDLQVNGGGGVLFNTTPTAEGACAIARAHRSTGTAAIFPTLITDAPEVMAQAADAVVAALGLDGVAGIHLEGPHISLARRGTHASRFVRPLDGQTIGIIARLRHMSVPVMVTLAPEAVTKGQIASLVRMGAVVAIGHSNAGSEEVQAALGEGAQCFTHLFNAMSQMQGREPGVVGAAINSQAYASMICDGIHVAPEMLGLAIRARPVDDRMFIVSDAMPTVAGPDSYQLYGQTIRLRNGRLVNQEGALAGAHVTMLGSVGFAVNRLGCSLDEALRMAISNPARLMSLPGRANLLGMAAQDVLLIDEDLAGCRFVLQG